MISSNARGLMSNTSPIRLGIPLKYQTCDTGAANSICPIRSRRTFERVTSTPQRSHTFPLLLIFFNLPHEHSKSFVGPKIFSQYRPSRSGFKVR